jgi:DNA-binding MarR family transcriptional regulator
MSGKNTNGPGTNLGQLIVRAFYWIDEGLQSNLQISGGPEITHSQSMIIMLIGEGIRRPSAIAERLGVSRQAVHQSIKDLIDLEVVELVPDPRDGRAKVARLSRKGAPIHRKAQKILNKLEAELGSRIGNQRVASLRDILEKDWGEPVIFD